MFIFYDLFLDERLSLSVFPLQNIKDGGLSRLCYFNSFT